MWGAGFWCWDWRDSSAGRVLPQERHDPYRTGGAAFEFFRGDDGDGTRRRDLLKVGDILEMVETVRQCVLANFQRAGSALIDAQRVNSQPKSVAGFDEEPRGVERESREMHRAASVGIAVLLG